MKQAQKNERTSGSAVERLVSRMGFEKCKWPPSEDDVCESCGKKNVQMYFAGPADAGTYWCLDCIFSCDEQNRVYVERINKLEQQGHSSHCAARQVYGDGECECAMYKKGYDPCAWVKSVLFG